MKRDFDISGYFGCLVKCVALILGELYFYEIETGDWMTAFQEKEKDERL